MSEMSRRTREDSAGPIGEAMRKRYGKFHDAGHHSYTWEAIRDVLLPTLLDIADELDAMRKERGQPKKGRE